MTFDELVEPHFDDKPDCNGAGGPRTEGPDLAATTRRERVLHQSHQQWLYAVYSKVYITQNKVNELKNEQIKSFVKHIKQLTKDQETMMRAAMAPGVRPRPADQRAINTNNAISNGGLGPTNLVHFPANLYTLWNEYEVSVGGNKAAKELSPKERGRVKSNKHCRRKKFLVAMEMLIAVGADSHTAIYRIHEVYGPNSKVSYILKAMGACKTNGGHVLLHRR